MYLLIYSPIIKFKIEKLAPTIRWWGSQEISAFKRTSSSSGTPSGIGQPTNLVSSGSFRDTGSPDFTCASLPSPFSKRRYRYPSTLRSLLSSSTAIVAKPRRCSRRHYCLCRRHVDSCEEETLVWCTKAPSGIGTQLSSCWHMRVPLKHVYAGLLGFSRFD